MCMTLLIALPINLNPTLKAFLRVGDVLVTKWSTNEDDVTEQVGGG